MSDLRKITKKELDEILRKHKTWLESDRKEGEMADLSNANLSDANLTCVH